MFLSEVDFTLTRSEIINWRYKIVIDGETGVLGKIYEVFVLTGAGSEMFDTHPNRDGGQK